MRTIPTKEDLLEVNGKRSLKYTLSKRIRKYFDIDNRNIKKTVYDKNNYPEMIMELARKQDGFITKQDVSKLLSISINQAYSEITKLVEANKLYKYCGGKYTKYKMIE